MPDFTRRHAHLWKLPDGTGLHASFGVLVSEDGTGRLCCHFCGRWYRFLGAHVRTHDLSAEQYRSRVGLARGRSLISSDLSDVVARRQARRYQESPELRDSVATGHELARTGALGRMNAAARREELLSGTAAREQRRALAAGRRTRALQRQRFVEAVVETSGAADLSDHLRQRYAAGASLDALARETGMGRDRLRRAMADAGIVLRRTGENTDEGRRSRAIAAEAAAACRVGTDDLGAWLAARRAEGWTLGRLGEDVGHSGHWVPWRLDSASGPGRAATTRITTSG